MLVGLAVLLTVFAGACAASSVRDYVQPRYGFSVSFPADSEVAVSKLPAKDGALTSFRAADEKERYQFTVFVSQPSEKGIYELDSKNAYLNGFVKSQVELAENGKLESTKQSTFLGHASLDYLYTQDIHGQRFGSRGVIFMLDGGHVRLSMWYPLDDKNAANRYGAFLSSFKLLPIAYHAGELVNSPSHKVSIQAPENWLTAPSTTGPTEVARFRNALRSMWLSASDSAAYGCQAFVADLKKAGEVTEAPQAKVGGKSFTKVLTAVEIPKYNTTLTQVFYCLDTSRGAVVLGAYEEKDMFWRWASVFEGAAGTITVQ